MLTPSAASAKRALERLEMLYRIGGGVGANRPGLSAAEHEACELTEGWMRAAGLRTSWDATGNLVGRLRGARPELPELWTGSHLDSVPDGGKFDGTLGVVAALEAVELIGSLERTLGVVVFRDEEGWRFGRGCFGSRSLCGTISPEELAVRDAGGVSVSEALAEFAAPAPPIALPGRFLELHIEQGPILSRAEAPVGIVTGVVGRARGNAVFVGSAAHAGTTPMEARHDALCESAEFILRVRDAARAIPGAVATVGRLEVDPGAVNVVPARVEAAVDARAPDRARLDALVEAIGIEVTRTEPVDFGPAIVSAVAEEAGRLGLPVVHLTSGAGHDAATLALAGVEAGMLFVRSGAGGVSHSPRETTSGEDVEVAIRALAACLERLGRA